MHRDGRFNPLEVLGQGVALFTVLGVAAVAWWRRESAKPLPPIDAAVQESYYRWLTAGRNITGPGPWKP